MKRFLLVYAVGLSLIMFGCRNTAPSATITPTAVALLATQNPTATPVPPTVDTANTPFPTLTATTTSTSTVTRTPRPATPRPTLTPTPGPSLPLPPPPSGSIIFLWDPNRYRDLGLIDTVNNLYVALPGETAIEWQVETLLESLNGKPSIALSPDQMRLAVTIVEDSNGSGSIETLGPSTDSANLFFYDLKTSDLVRLTDNYLDSWTISWVPDSSAIAYARFERLFSVNTNNLSINTLIDQLPDKVTRILWSPQGNSLAIELQDGSLFLYLPESGELLSPENVPPGNSSTILWSPNGEWLASSIIYSLGLFVVNTRTNEAVTLVNAEFSSLSSWSPDSQYLAYSQIERNDLINLYDTSVYLWDSKTQESHLILPKMQTKSHALWTPDGKQLVIGHLANEGQTLDLSLIDIDTGQTVTLWQSAFVDQNSSVYPISWSPDGTQLVMGYLADEGQTLTLSLIDINTGQLTTLWQSSFFADPSSTVQPIGWSPDGQWLLFFAQEAGKTGLSEIFNAGVYTVHRSGGEPILILNTANEQTQTFHPYGFYWLSQELLVLPSNE
ncbi:hypothetical protein MNBD_CHLOROFLEXI01-294 [hydrothermal vent metagenome]|uniref:TolB protein, periplasmic protein involved in the tonb-independent uptake of group A colicins n=1 Tax=hydrothermal vent metagenome TaxID=652676 RepID=A0A3B0VX63_9ZZZZ